MNTKIAISALVVSLGVLVAHIIGTQEYLYVRIKGYDVPMHFFGGMAVVLGLATVWSILKRVPLQGLWKLVVMTAIVATAWELFESYYNIAGAPLGTQWYWIDTTKDIIIGSFGAMFAVLFIKRIQ